jgi:hypothetical protein
MRHHGALCNREIAVTCYMNESDYYECAEGLEEHGLIGWIDFAGVDTFSHTIEYEAAKRSGEDQEILEDILDIGIDWLKVDIRENAYWMSYKG